MPSISFGSRLRKAWNVFMNRDPTKFTMDIGPANYGKPDRIFLTRGAERTIITSIYNRIALDVSSIKIQHVKLDENDRYMGVVNSPLNNCLTLQPNIDQTARAFFQDVVLSMFDEGCVAIVPIDTDRDPETGSFDVETMRVGKIVEWYPRHVKVEAYNDITGQREQVIFSKETCAIIENPFYAVMNAPNSTMQRLIRKLSLLDILDEKTGQGKLDIFIQLPYTIKTEARRQQAENRRKEIENQLASSKYGIAYTDGTEHITQLNRPAENSLLSQIEYLTNMVYSQLGINTGILDGTANEETMLNYYSRLIEPIAAAIADAIKIAFLTKTARTQRQSIKYFRDPFNLVPVSNIAEIADKFTRNEIMTSNEIRQIIGMKPSSDPNADKLRNSNIASPNGQEQPQEEGLTSEISEEGEDDESAILDFEQFLEAIKSLDSVDDDLDALQAEVDGDELKHYASPYYDPQKAHEYYERTKKLKGRKSTAGLNDEGKAAAKYVKQQIDAEKKQKIQSSKELQNKNIKTSSDTTKTSRKQAQEKKAATIKANSERLKTEVASLRNSYKGLSKEERAAKKEQINSKIADLRAKNKAEREKLSAEYKAYADKLTSTHKDYSTSERKAHKERSDQYRKEADEKYEAELEKMRGDSSMQKVSKKKK